VPDAMTASVTRHSRRGDVTVEAADVGEEFDGETVAFDRGDLVAVHRAEQLGGPIRGQASRCATGHQFPQRGVESARRLGAQRP
jgi:hypothetical protein